MTPVNEFIKMRDIAQNEFGFFFKDDWKATRDLTLNVGHALGLFWRAVGTQWADHSFTGWRKFAVWHIRPGLRQLDETRSPRGSDTHHLCRANSPNPDQAIYNRDLNNFGPAIGFACKVPWGGEDKTTVRGGYQIQYTGGGRGFVLDTAIGNPPGSSNTAGYIIPTSDPYFSLEKVVANPSISPVQPLFLPSKDTLIPVTDRSGLLNAFDPQFRDSVYPEPHPVGDA